MYDKFPFVETGTASECLQGWQAITAELRNHSGSAICIECYPGVFVDEIQQALAEFMPEWRVFLSQDALLPAPQLDATFADLLSDDPVFGRMSATPLEAFFDTDALLQT